MNIPHNLCKEHEINQMVMLFIPLDKDRNDCRITNRFSALYCWAALNQMESPIISPVFRL